MIQRSLLFLALAFAAPLQAETLKEWSQGLERPEIQQAILARIFSGNVGPMSAGILNRQTGIYLFPKNDSWVRLGSNSVYHAKDSNAPEYLAVTSMFYNRPDRAPVTAAAYVFFSTTDRPAVISSGYAGQESVRYANLPNLKQQFLVLLDGFGQGTSKQSSAQVLQIDSTGRVRMVWKTPPSVRNFSMGFAPLGGKEERLVLQSRKSDTIDYSAYAWSGDRFEVDSFASSTRIRDLPEEVWVFSSF